MEKQPAVLTDMKANSAHANNSVNITSVIHSKDAYSMPSIENYVVEHTKQPEAKLRSRQVKEEETGLETTVIVCIIM